MRKKNFIGIVVFIALFIFLPSCLAEASGKVKINVRHMGRACEGVSFRAYPINKNISDETEFADKYRDYSDKMLEETFGNSFSLGPSSKEGVILSSLPVGKYFIRQIDDADNTFVFILNVKDETSVTKVIPKAYGRGNVSLLKTSTTGALLEGASFKLYRRVGDEVISVPIKNNHYSRNNGSFDVSLKTDRDGLLRIENLPSGSYFFREVLAPTGYILRDEEIPFIVTRLQTKDIVFENMKAYLGEMTFLKVDERNDNPLFGASFLVSRKLDDEIKPVEIDGVNYVVTSDEKGLFKVENLPYGVYTLTEIKAPKGYQKLSSSVEFNIDEQSKNKVMIIKNKAIGRKLFRPRLPNTGTIFIFIMVIISIGLCGFGIKLMREGRKK